MILKKGFVDFNAIKLIDKNINETECKINLVLVGITNRVTDVPKKISTPAIDNVMRGKKTTNLSN